MKQKTKQGCCLTFFTLLCPKDKEKEKLLDRNSKEDIESAQNYYENGFKDYVNIDDSKISIEEDLKTYGGERYRSHDSDDMRLVN